MHFENNCTIVPYCTMMHLWTMICSGRKGTHIPMIYEIHLNKIIQNRHAVYCIKIHVLWCTVVMYVRMRYLIPRIYFSTSICYLTY